MFNNLPMKNLIEILTEQTQSLKKQYLEFTEKYAKKEFHELELRTTWNMPTWYDYFGIKYEYKVNQWNPNVSTCAPVATEYHRKNLYKMREAFNGCRTTVKEGFDKFLAKELKYAEIHYKQSIEKLATRIEKKGLDQSKLEVTTSHIGVNINTTLTDGVQTVRAFTIIASGEIQRPHYRYLIK